ncbi:hypothetical protein RER_56030 [Rhodococcus erythropolis PR4]|uniref:Uncharacterized protein n=1 Tax=Rhodococcus erythropolis (strain PR4 / NBRC 100887) TaxID=234621 RepID=C0ZTP5_RHOE4|nr:hypothetical protein RER_56030 [Rhodococcus erythropolis PR4]
MKLDSCAANRFSTFAVIRSVKQAALAVEALLALIDGDEPSAPTHTRSELRIRASTAHSLTP